MRDSTPNGIIVRSFVSRDSADSAIKGLSKGLVLATGLGFVAVGTGMAFEKTSEAAAQQINIENQTMVMLADPTREQTGIRKTQNQIDRTVPQELALKVERIYRFLRAGFTMALIIADYKYSLYGIDDKEERERYRAIRNECHDRASTRLLDLCKALSGTYTKAAQQIASMGHAAPQQFVKKMKLLQDHATTHSFDNVERIFQSEFGRSPHEMFDEFSETPIASASLAQVHRARLKDTGEMVAVKVQHPFLVERFDMDLWTIEVMVDVLMWFFPTFQFGFLVPSFREQLEQELDFRQEAANCMEMGRLFESSARVRVPQIKPDQSTSRILTMEFVHGCRIDDVTELKKRGINPVTVAEETMDCFSKQIFVFGQVNCDPHPANVLVRVPGEHQDQFSDADVKTNLNAPFELVLLDHGLYRKLTDEFRLAYCDIWQGIVLRDDEKTKRAANKLGIHDHWKLFSVMLVLPALDQSKSGKVKLPMSKKDLKGIGSDFVTIMTTISEILNGTTLDLRLILKTNNLLRSLNRDLSGNVNLFHIMANHAAKGKHVRNEVLTKTESGQIVRTRKPNSQRLGFSEHRAHPQNPIPPTRFAAEFIPRPV